MTIWPWKRIRELEQENTILKCNLADSHHTISQLTPIVNDTLSAMGHADNGSPDSINELGLSGRSRNALARHGIFTLAELLATPRQELKKDVINFGKVSYEEVEQALASRGLGLDT